MFCFNNNRPVSVSHDIIPYLKAFLALLLIALAPQGFCVLHQTHLSRQMLIGCSLFERKRRCFWLLDPLREWVFPGYFSSLYILPHSPACLDTWTDPAHRGTAIIRDTVSMRKQIVPAPWKSFALAHMANLNRNCPIQENIHRHFKEGKLCLVSPLYPKKNPFHPKSSRMIFPAWPLPHSPAWTLRHLKRLRHLS